MTNARASNQDTLDGGSSDGCCCQKLPGFGHYSAEQQKHFRNFEGLSRGCCGQTQQRIGVHPNFLPLRPRSQLLLLQSELRRRHSLRVSAAVRFGVPREVFSMLFECSTETGAGRTSVCSLQVPYKSSLTIDPITHIMCLLSSIKLDANHH